MTMRIKEIDFTKGMLILLVISFHLVYIEHLYPYAKQVVYTFHMPAFLFISGYLMNTEKQPKAFCQSLLWLVFPYLVMESGYVMMAAVLPINEHIDNLNAAVFLDKVLYHPIGPYWYLHTLIQCEAVVYFSIRLKSFARVSRFVMACLLLYILANAFSLLSFTSAAYFIAGAIIRHAGMSVVHFCKPSLLALIAFAVLVGKLQNLNASTITGAMIVYMSMSGCAFFYNHSGLIVRSVLQFLGRNTMPFYLFSPIFTILCKPVAPLLAFDSTGILFLLLALTICTTGSLLIAIIIDKTGMSRLMFGKKGIIHHHNFVKSSFII